MSKSKYYECRCCGRKTTIYSRQLNEGHIYILLELCEEFYVNKKSVHYSELQAKVREKYKKNVTDYPLLTYFGLMKRDDDKTGFYKPTREGYSFLMNEISIAKYYYYDVGQFSTEQTTVRQLLEIPLQVVG